MIDYTVAGPMTTLAAIDPAPLSPIPHDAVSICRLVSGLVIQPTDAQSLGLPETRFAENQIRPAADLVNALLAMNPAPLTTRREPHHRVIGTCRHFALLGCALLRHRGFAARVRCGFATYFQPGQGLDHWITEYRHDNRWIRIDPEILGQSLLTHPEDLAPNDFHTGAEAWTAFRAGHLDATTYGVHGTTNFGPAEIRGNAVKDLAALNKVEMLPWDEWGRMTASYNGETGPDYDALLDTVATICTTDDPTAIAALYTGELRVPPALAQGTHGQFPAAD